MIYRILPLLLLANGLVNAQRTPQPPLELEKAHGKTILVFTSAPRRRYFLLCRHPSAA